MSPLRNISAVEDSIVRELLRQTQKDIDALRVRMARMEAISDVVESYSNANRPRAETRPYKVIFNTDDSFLNVSDGTNWRDPNGAVT